MKLIFTILILGLVFGLALVLGSQNDQTVTVNYLIAQGDFRLSSLLGGLLVAGFVIGWLTCWFVYLKAKVQLRSANRRIEKQKKELEELRSLPAKD